MKKVVQKGMTKKNLLTIAIISAVILSVLFLLNFVVSDPAPGSIGEVLQKVWSSTTGLFVKGGTLKTFADEGCSGGIPNGICEIAVYGENNVTCSSDCPASCGNLVCESSYGETAYTCPYDCATNCGNGIIDDGEVCDGTNLSGQTCCGLGLAGGMISCGSDCTSFNLLGCRAIGTAPSASSVVLTTTNTSNNNTNQNLTITSIAVSDVNGNDISCAYSWYKNNSKNSTTLITSGLVSYWPLNNETYDYAGCSDGTESSGSSFSDSFINISAWTTLSGSWSANGALLKSGDGHQAIKVTSITAENGLISTKIYPYSNYNGVIFRAQDNTNYYFAALHPDGSSIRLIKANATDANNIVNYTSVTVSGSWHNMTVEYRTEGSGMRVKIWMDGTLYLNYLDTSPQWTTGGVGCRSYYGGVQWDDFNFNSLPDSNVLAAGKVGNAYDLDGSKWINIGAQSSGTQITLAAWIKTSATEPGYILGTHPSETSLWLINVDGGVGKTARIAYDNNGAASGGETTLSGTSNVQDGNWHHIVGVVNATGGSIYVDGVLENSNTQPGNWAGGNAAIGRSLTGAYPWFFDGLVDEAMIYNRALSSSEVKQLYDASKYGGVKIANDTPFTAGDVWKVGITPLDFALSGSETQSNAITLQGTCAPSMTNSTGSWANITSCQANDTILQQRNITQYDTNFCGTVGNTTYTQHQEIECDYCTPSMTYTDWTSWSNTTCAGTQMNQSRSRVYYDLNFCGETGNSTEYGYQLVGPTYVNTSWSSWANVTSCQANSTVLQGRSLVQYDIYVCAGNTTFFGYQEIGCTLPPTANNFDTTYGSTNFSAVEDLTSVPDLTLATADAKIIWEDNVNVSGQDLDENIVFGDGFVSVNSDVLSDTFNSSATVTIQNVDCEKYAIYYADGTFDTKHNVVAQKKICSAATDPSCTGISCVGTTLTFTVSHFTGFAVGENSGLTIYDSTDPEGGDETKYALDDVDFYANYSNITSAQPITGATCKVKFKIGSLWTNWFSMAYNSGLYEYTTQFASSGTYTWNVSCNDTTGDYEALQATDTVVITSSGGGGGGGGGGGPGTGNITAEIDEIVSVTLPVDVVNFGNITQGTNYVNLTGLQIQNDGTVRVNIDVNASTLFTSSTMPWPGINYMFRAAGAGEGDWNEGVFDVKSLIDWTNVSSTAQTAIFNLDYNNSIDIAALQFNITVPMDEPAGAKESIVYITASQAMY